MREGKRGGRKYLKPRENAVRTLFGIVFFHHVYHRKRSEIGDDTDDADDPDRADKT